MDLLINIGNTHCEFCDENMQVFGKIKTKELLKNIPEVFYTAQKLWISSVVPVASKKIITQFEPKKTHFLTTKNSAGIIDFSLVDACTIGADRIANAIAVTTRKLPAIVIDCGTCITGEVIDSKQRFLGGFILPGRKLQRQALNLFTGQLPDIPLSESLPKACGTTTTEAIQSGIDLALSKSLFALIQACIQQHELDIPEIIFTGGDSNFFTKPDGINIDEENITLQGLKIWRNSITLSIMDEIK